MRGRHSRTAVLAVTLAGMLGLGLLATPVHAGGQGPAHDLQFRGEATLAAELQFEGTRVGGLSSITYDPRRDVYYAISDDQVGVRFYTLRADVADGRLDPGDVSVVDVMALEPPPGEAWGPGLVDPEGLTLTRDRTLIVTSEGNAANGVDPWIREYRLDGSYVRDLEVPSAFEVGPEQGVRTNLGFESAAVSPNGQFLFSANEAALVQDGPAATPTNGSVARILRYRLRTGEVRRSYAYPVEPVAATPVPPDAFSVNGLVELLPLNNQHLIAMERSFSVGVGNSVTLYRVSLAGAQDVSDLPALAGVDVREVRKTELLDLSSLGLTLDNLEGMTWGPRLRHGSQSLLVVSDNNFTPGQPSQFLLLTLR